MWTAFHGFDFDSGGDGAAAPTAPPPDFAEWPAGVEAARARSRVHPAITASGMEGTEPEVVLDPDYDAGRAKGARDLDLPPWTKGRHGSAIGRAVHAVLQVVDLATGADLESAVTAQCVVEGIAGQEQIVRSLIESARRRQIQRLGLFSRVFVRNELVDREIQR